MKIIRGTVDDVELTGTLYEPGERAPQFKGVPDEDAPYVWVCDEFYEVESGGQLQRIAGHDVKLAFERPMPRGFEDREQAIEAAKEHIRMQFARIGIESEDSEIEGPLKPSTANRTRVLNRGGVPCIESLRWSVPGK